MPQLVLTVEVLAHDAGLGVIFHFTLYSGRFGRTAKDADEAPRAKRSSSLYYCLFPFYSVIFPECLHGRANVGTTCLSTGNGNCPNKHLAMADSNDGWTI